jgi:hypothetical protein
MNFTSLSQPIFIVYEQLPVTANTAGSNTKTEDDAIYLHFFYVSADLSASLHLSWISQ